MDVKLLSLDELQIQLSEPVYKHLLSTYSKIDHEEPVHYLQRILERWKQPPANCIFRVNLLMTTTEDVIHSLQQLMENWVSDSIPDQSSSLHFTVERDLVLDDVVQILIHSSDPSLQPIPHCQGPRVSTLPLLYPHWPKRSHIGWPLTHKVVVCDRLCGEAVLRGSNVFVGGILAADMKIDPGDPVAVYADIRDAKDTRIHRGVFLDHFQGTAVYLGVGTAACTRAEMFRQSKGLGILMSMQDRAGPILPPLSGWLEHKVHLQNLPSIVVAHVLDPQPGDVIFDMCAAPGGKTMHLASLVRNQATIVASDKSRKKMVTARALFASFQCTCVTPLALDSAHCVIRDSPETEWKSVTEVRSCSNLTCHLFYYLFLNSRTNAPTD
jgi:predicted ribosome-associated RNA-binding protein Tma20